MVAWVATRVYESRRSRREQAAIAAFWQAQESRGRNGEVLSPENVLTIYTEEVPSIENVLAIYTLMLEVYRDRVG
jgi:hypothetical protein